MPTKVRIVSPEGRCTVLSGQTDFATIKEKGRELLVFGDVICHDHDHNRDHGKAVERAHTRRESYDVRFSLSCSSPEHKCGDGREGEGGWDGEEGERVVSVGVEWLPPRNRA